MEKLVRATSGAISVVVSLMLLLNFITGHLYEAKIGQDQIKIDVQCLKFYLSLKSPAWLVSQTRVDLRKIDKNINLIKIKFPFSFINNSFEGKCVCEAFGNILSNEPLFCGCSK